MICRICHNADRNKEIMLQGTMYGTKGEYPYFICGKCGCLQIKEEVGDLEAYYDADKYYSFAMNKRKLKNTLLFLQLKNQIAAFSPIGKLVESIYPVNYRFFLLIHKEDALLDVGAGDGELLRWLWKLGYRNVMGIDPYVKKDIIWNGKKLVVKADAIDYKFEHKYKMIVMMHSLEHIYHQREQMEALDACLEKGGFLVFQLPVFSQYYWELYATRLYTLDPPRHVYIHTQKSLEELMAPFSYKLIEYTTEIDVAIPRMAYHIKHGNTEKNGGTGFITGTLSSLKSKGLRKRLIKENDGAIATVVFQKL